MQTPHDNRDAEKDEGAKAAGYGGKAEGRRENEKRIAHRAAVFTLHLRPF
jgi:hypothetical protein